MRKSLLLVLAFALSGSPALAQSKATEVLVDRARSLEARGRPDLAEQAWQRVLTIEPNNADALAGMARATKARGASAQARSYLERLKKVKPDHPAIAQIETSAAMGSQQRTLLQEAGKLAQARQYDNAMAIYRQVFGSQPPAGEWTVAYYETEAALPGGWETATNKLNALVKAHPDAAAYRLCLGKLLTYRPATRASGMRMLESVGAGSGYDQQAREAWRQALVWENGSNASAPSLRRYVARYPDNEIRNLLSRAEKQAPPVKTDALYAKELETAYAALKAGRTDEAETRFRGILQRAPKEEQALAGLGYAQMGKRDFRAALENLEAARALEPGNAQVNRSIAESRFWTLMQDASKALQEQRTQDAQDLFAKALELRPSDSAALEGYAGALMQRGNIAEAAPVLERIVRVQPDNVDAWRTLVNASYAKSGAQAALGVVRTIPQAVSNKLNQDLQHQILLVSIYRDGGLPVESRRAFERAAVLAKTQRTVPEGVELQLAGLYLQYGEPADAVALYQRLVDDRSENLDAWEGLMTSLNRAKASQRAMKELEALPTTIRADALKRPGFLRAVASVQLSLGNAGSAEAMLRRALELESADGSTPSFYTQVQLAQVWLDQGQRDRAAWLFNELTKDYPNNAEGWKGFLLAFYRDNRAAEAIEATRRIPPGTLQGMQDDPDFLGLMASIYDAAGQSDEALATVRRAVARYQAAGQRAPSELAIQLSWLLLQNEEDSRELFSLVKDTRARTDLTMEEQQELSEILIAWVLRSAAKTGRSGDSERAITILETAQRVMPAEARIRWALAGRLLASGDSRSALSLYKKGLKNATAVDYVAAVGTALAERDTQLGEAWLTEGLKKFPKEPELLDIAGRQAAAKGDLTKAQAFWQQALAGMDRAARDSNGQARYPDETDQLGVLLTGADESRPTGRITYKGNLGALPGAAGQPRSTNPPAGSNGTTTAPSWLTAPGPALMGEPQGAPARDSNPARSEPNRKPAQARPSGSSAATAPRATLAYWSDINPAAEAGLASTAGSAQQRTASSASDSPAPRAAAPEASGEEKARPRGTLAQVAPLPVYREPDSRPSGQGSRQTAEPQRRETAPAFTDDVDALELFTSQFPAAAGSGSQTGLTPEEDISARQKIAEQLQAIENRNSPTGGLGGNFQARSGQPGFDRMMLQETVLEASTVALNKVRFRLAAKGIFMNSPAPDGQATMRFGLLPLGDGFEAPAYSGLAVDASVSTATVGAHAGASPQSFPVRNYYAGFRFRPASGPITIQFDRAPVQDSILSYAGAREPVTGVTWGGVVANIATLTGNFGAEKSGAYFSTGFQYLTGKDVPTNQRIDGTVGTYWRLAATPAGSLTAGLNIFAMHYGKNLRYFTLGQGGYFSPQRFVLVNAPVTWAGSWKALQYSASASVGSQSFSEDSSPYFPTRAALQGTTALFYPRFSNSGSSYNVDFRIAYEMAPNWYVGGFMNANNARYYSLQSTGVMVRYDFHARPRQTDIKIPTVPDWTGKQLNGLP